MLFSVDPITLFIDEVVAPQEIDDDEAKRRLSYRTEPGLNLESHLTLLTNVTSVTIPLVVFDGKLQQVSLSPESIFQWT